MHEPTISMINSSLRRRKLPDAVPVEFMKGQYTPGVQIAGKLSEHRRRIWLKLQDAGTNDHVEAPFLSVPLESDWQAILR
jgi:hypothetical protein